MHQFDLRPTTGGVELSGCQLEAPMNFRERDAGQRAIHLVGFLSQTDGGLLHFHDEVGAVVETKEFRESPLATSRLSGVN